MTASQFEESILKQAHEHAMQDEAMATVELSLDQSNTMEEIDNKEKFLPENEYSFETRFSKFTNTFQSKSGSHITVLKISVRPNQILEFISNEKQLSYKQGYEDGAYEISQATQEARIEHCGEPRCPECNLKAYEQGRKDLLYTLQQQVEGLRHEIGQNEIDLGNEQWKIGHTKCLVEVLKIISDSK